MGFRNQAIKNINNEINRKMKKNIKEYAHLEEQESDFHIRSTVTS